MRAGDIFRFAHMSVFVTSIGVGVLGFSMMASPAAYAQTVEELPTDDIPTLDFPEEEEDYPQDEVPEEDVPEEEYEEEYEEPRMEPRARTENLRDVDDPKDNRLPPKKKRIVKSDRESAAPPSSRRADPAISTSVSEAIGNSAAFCDQLIDERYKIDCVGERLLAAARQLPQTEDYAEARAILIEAGEKIRALAKANQAPSAPVGRAVGKINNTQVRTRPLVPVKRERIKPVAQQAAAILQEAETKLLRAAASSDRRLIAYAQIAKAVGSNKKLLRSA